MGNAETATFDVVILGNGLAGAALAAVLARQHTRVALVSEDTHPRHTPGEIATPYTATLLRVLAERYAVPELTALATARQCRTEVSARVGTARANSFVYHRADGRRVPGEVFQLAPPRIMPAPPIWYRQDVDAYVFHTACRYGATSYQQAAVTAVEADPDGVTVLLSHGRRLRARYLVDTGGRGTPLVDRLGAAEEPARLRHRSVTMTTEMVNVRPFDEVDRGGRFRPPVPWAAGPLHHVFPGGYVWVVPFGDAAGTWAVGASLTDAEPDVPAGDRWQTLLDRFPDLAAQLRDARAVQPWTTAESPQRSSVTSVGDRWCALGEAAAFVDPLLSRPLLRGLEGVNLLAWRLIQAVRTGDFATERFRLLDDFAQRCADVDDRLVRTFAAAAADYRLWKAFLQVWEIGSFYGRLTVERALADLRAGADDAGLRRLETAKYLGLPFPSHEGYHELFERTCADVEEVAAGRTGAHRAAERIHTGLRGSGLVPPGLPLADEALRFLHPGPADLARLVLWGRRGAPEELRPLLAQLAGRRRRGPTTDRGSTDD